MTSIPAASEEISSLRRFVRAARSRCRSTVQLPFAAARVGANVARRSLGRADYGRWSSQDGLEDWWSARTQQIARLIKPGSRVIEFGAGQRRLEQYLDPTSTYVPSDLVSRGPGTIVFDLNQRPLFDLAAVGADVAVFAGVLEYVRDIDLIVRWLAAAVPMCIASYDCVSQRRSVLRRTRDWLRRTHFGYMSSLSENELRGCFAAAGFQCASCDAWTSQRIFTFVNRAS
jgi:hypothetical protein